MPDDAECGIPAIQVGPRPICRRLLITPLRTGEHSVKVSEVGILGIDGSLLKNSEGGLRLRHSCRGFCLKNCEAVIVWVCWGSDHPDAGPCKGSFEVKAGHGRCSIYIPCRALKSLKQHQNDKKRRQRSLTREQGQGVSDNGMLILAETVAGVTKNRLLCSLACSRTSAADPSKQLL